MPSKNEPETTTINRIRKTLEAMTEDARIRTRAILDADPEPEMSEKDRKGMTSVVRDYGRLTEAGREYADRALRPLFIPFEDAVDEFATGTPS